MTKHEDTNSKLPIIKNCPFVLKCVMAVLFGASFVAGVVFLMLALTSNATIQNLQICACCIVASTFIWFLFIGTAKNAREKGVFTVVYFAMIIFAMVPVVALLNYKPAENKIIQEDVVIGD